MKTFLGFTTYPTKNPIHGGQRRIQAFNEFYARLAISYNSVCVYEPAHYSQSDVGPDDIALPSDGIASSSIPFINDLLSGRYAANNPSVVEHFTRLVARLKPSALVLEHPFMWPLVRRILSDRRFASIPVIYSSHNWEPPLKREILIRAGVAGVIADQICCEIEDLENELVTASILTVAVSDADAGIYNAIKPSSCVLVRNGVTRPAASVVPPKKPTSDQTKYFFFVGSAYPPNIDGLCKMVLVDGLFFVPPEKSFVLCGGAASGAMNDPRFMRFSNSNHRRIEFFPQIDDAQLDMLLSSAHAIILPINFGGGSNLKTAQALASCKWIVATTTAMRGFESFIGQPGVVVADDPLLFRQKLIEVLQEKPLQLSAQEREIRDTVHWDRLFDNYEYSLKRLGLI
jgi:glycosyltransferase involved in cell wall biosynthesis